MGEQAGGGSFGPAAQHRGGTRTADATAACGAAAATAAAGLWLLPHDEEAAGCELVGAGPEGDQGVVALESVVVKNLNKWSGVVKNLT